MANDETELEHSGLEDELRGPGQLRGFELSERFVSLQGEGPSLGCPAVFLRFMRCNLKCSFCDTPYTWDRSRFDLKQETRTFSLSELVSYCRAQGPRRLILTGGEPLLHGAQLELLLQALDQACAEHGEESFFVEVETNGTLAPSVYLERRVQQFNVSPKLSGSAQRADLALRDSSLLALRNTGKAWFKFVVSETSELEQVKLWVEKLGLERERVLLMPEAQTAEQLTQRSAQVAAWALEAGYRMSTRLHLLLYGGRRGT